jgi:protein-tyrosine-phosphatase
MAEGFARRFGRGVIEPYSAGSRPSGIVHPGAVYVMQEKGVDISGHSSKGFDALPSGDFDYVVTMGCGDACPAVAARKRLEWKIPDPKGKILASFREARDLIADKVQEFIRELENT